MKKEFAEQKKLEREKAQLEKKKNVQIRKIQGERKKQMGAWNQSLEVWEPLVCKMYNMYKWSMKFTIIKKCNLLFTFVGRVFYSIASLSTLRFGGWTRHVTGMFFANLDWLRLPNFKEGWKITYNMYNYLVGSVCCTPGSSTNTN